ncbi:MAG: phosphomannomutase/phosphoglucomutase [Proteobacteria bacterium]|nr:phosphomannomutase/phosphoglucomutase [Pseudomonadota bacterium]
MQKDYAGIFKANDIRGIYTETLDEDIAYRIGLALAKSATHAAAPTLAVGRDGRLSSPVLAQALIEGLTAGGIDIVDVGLVPTPALYYAAVTQCNGCGVMVTGSHNPKNYNGMKMMLNRQVLMGEAMATLRENAMDSNAMAANNTEVSNHRGNITPAAIMEEYIAAVAAANPLSRKIKIVIDAGNGAAGEYAPALFRAMGCDVVPLFCEIDGNFPNHHPDPAQPENLLDAADSLAACAGEVAFAFDGDGDRLGVLPAGQKAVFSDRMLMLYARDVLARNPQARVVFDVKCTSHLAPWVEQHGGIADMQPTGHAFIKARMAETGALLGGEMSGHFYFRENWYGFDDALFAGARLAAILADNPDVFSDIPDSVSSPELQVDMSGKNQHEFIATLSQQADFPGAKQVVTIDGLRVEYEYGFGLVRASNTTPTLVLRFEARDNQHLELIKETFRQILHKADSSLILPF